MNVPKQIRRLLPRARSLLIPILVASLHAGTATFTSSGTWTVPSGVTTVDVLVIAGGGGGGGDTGGAGGAGGVKHDGSYAVTPSANLTVTIGAGGAGSWWGSNGGNSVFATITAHGGGGGGTYNGNATSGGSGGGGGSGESGDPGGAGGSGTAFEGNNGANGLTAGGPGNAQNPGGGGGGGGGAASGATGGAAVTFNSVAYAGGGGGGAGRNAGAGGGGGAGAGGEGLFVAGANATANTGSGGGGGGGAAMGGDGGSGIVIINWIDNPPTITSSTTASGKVGVPFSYTIVASDLPSSYGASGLPSGLSLNTSTGVISGTVATTGVYSIAISATNAAGTGNATLVLAILQTSSATFTSSGSWTVPTGVTSVELLVVGGGGGGGSGYGGGGGGGDVNYAGSYSVTPGASVTVTVGAGGAGSTTYAAKGSNGGTSSFGSYSSIGGGGGGSITNPNGSSGGSGGGGAGWISYGVGSGAAATGTHGHGGGDGEYADSNGGGGGGAGSAGQNADASGNGNGGNGLAYDLSGSSTYYGGGGGGGVPTAHTAGTGGLGGGGAGGVEGDQSGAAGAANTGGGGGGSNSSGGRAGGSGIVIVRWAIPAPVISSPTTATGGVNAAFSYSIAATNSPLSYSASGLPSGLSIDTGTGVISGTPTAAGTYSVTLGAGNATGTGNATLALSVATSSTLPGSSDFESGSGYTLADVAGQHNWLGTASLATVSTDDAHGGSRSLKLAGNSTPASALQYFDGTGSPSIAFVDLSARPVAATAAANSTLIQTESASVGFQISGGQGEIYVFDGVGSNQWLGTGVKFDVNGSNQATGWLRLTLREDYTRHKWDLYVNGVLADYDLAFGSNAENCLRLLTLKGHTSAAAYYDDVSAQSTNPLFTDSDKDGMADAWETAHGLNTSTDDRNSDHDSDGRTNIEEYFAGTDANNADVTAPSAPGTLRIHATAPNSLVLSWGVPADTGAGTTGIAGYNVYRSGTKVNSVLVTGTNFADTGLSPGSSYTYTIRAVDLAGNVSAASSGLTITTETSSTSGAAEVFSPLSN